MRVMKARAAVIACCVVVCTGTGLSAGVASADEPDDTISKAVDNQAGGSRSELDVFMREMGGEFLANQEALGDLKSWILGQPGAAGSGYIDQINYADSRSVRLLWHGNDAFLAKVLEQARSMGIKASVERRSMSLSQIDEATKRVWDQAEVFAGRGFVIKSIAGVGMEDTGLDVEGVYTGVIADKAFRGAPEQVQQARKALADSIADVAGARVGLVEADSDNAVTRSKDVSPFWAGGYMINALITG